jgi:glucose-6-phosphate 1-dehydrogenase
MAIPPFIFMKVARAIGDSGLVNCGERREGWSRAVIEKPFGHDRASSDDLVRQMASVFSESQTYRIDHYLGKELIQNVMALRFANRVFEPLWNREHIESVSVSFSEDFGVEGRAGYFDKYGIVRDVMQNHLLQILSLLAMERPAKYDSKAIRDEKVRVLRAVRPLTAGDFVLGQYVAGKIKGQPRPGYKEAKDVAPDSRTPTFAAAVLGVDNERWRGVPFLLAAGKALESRRADIHIRFRPLAHNIYDDGELAHNELVIRVQPDEAILLRINNKAPGQDLALAPIELDLRYARAYPVALPEAYESLLLDVVVGDKSLFIRSDELAVAWDIFTPALHEIEERRIEPEPYAYGSAGPEAFQSMRATWRLP